MEEEAAVEEADPVEEAAPVEEVKAEVADEADESKDKES